MRMVLKVIWFVVGNKDIFKFIINLWEFIKLWNIVFYWRRFGFYCVWVICVGIVKFWIKGGCVVNFM